MWNIFFNKKEKEMPPTKNNSATGIAELQDTINSQRSEISRLQDRISTLTDEVTMLNSDIKRFKNNVANDINELFTKIQS